MSDTEFREKRKPVDWEGVQRDVRSGMFTVAEIARRHSVTPQAIHKRIKKNNWPQGDLVSKVRAKAKDLTLKKVKAEAEDKYTDDEIVLFCADQMAEIAKSQQSSVRRLMSLESSLMIEFEREIQVRQAVFSGADCPDAIKMETAGIKPQSLMQMAAIYQQLVHAQYRRVQTERKVYNMDDDTVSSGDPIKQLLEEIDGITQAPPSIDEQ